MKAIKHVGGNLVAAFDPKDSVGILDSMFPECKFFTEFEIFESYVESQDIDYCVICSPNYLHEHHIRFAIRHGINVICEKPIVLSEDTARFLSVLAMQKNVKINCILQLRLHEKIKALKDKYPIHDHHVIKIKYIAPRGDWYQKSWKTDLKKSGGVVPNIGIHFFDMCRWIFGDIIRTDTQQNETLKASGHTLLQNGHIHWELSTDKNDLPKGNKTYRSITIDGEEVEFSDGFTELHNKSYEQIMEGKGFDISQTINTLKIMG